MTKILLADDEEREIEYLDAILTDKGYVVSHILYSRYALDMISEESFDIAVIAIELSFQESIDLINELKRKNSNIQILAISKEPNLESAKRAVGAQVFEYLVKPIEKIKILRSLELADRKKKILDENRVLESENDTYRMQLEKMVLEKTDSLKKLLTDTIIMIASLGEMRNPFLAGHHKRVADLAYTIGKKLKIGKRAMDCLLISGCMHDIGMMNIPVEILSKPDSLNGREYEIVKEHVISGHELLKNIKLPWPVAETMFQHHERLDGSGYPNKLDGKQMTLEGKILATADVIDSMMSDRPNRPGHSVEYTLDVLKREREKLFFPDAVDAACSLFEYEGYSNSETEQLELKVLLRINSIGFFDFQM